MLLLGGQLGLFWGRVYGEDDPKRAELGTLTRLFSYVRKNYFNLYLHYSYFNLGRQSVIQMNWVFIFFVLIPTIVAGIMTFGVFTQIRVAINKVSSGFQCLVQAWPSIIETLSIRKRLWQFEQAIKEHSVDKPAA